MFLLKKIAAPFFAPLPLCFGLFFIGLSILWFSKKQKIGKILLTSGVIVLLLFSYGIFTHGLLNNFEKKYPTLNLESAEETKEIRWIVILGGGATSDPKLPVTSQLSQATLIRLVEGIRIYRKIPGSKLILSGGKVFNTMPEAMVMCQLAVELGVPDKDILIEMKSKNTEEQARFIKELVKSDKFILVTSAYHMQRAMVLFNSSNLDPLPSPTGHLIKTPQQMNPLSFFPNSSKIEHGEKVIREIMALLWTKLHGLT